MQAEPEAPPVQRLPQGKLRARVLSLDASHHPRSGRGINDIGHAVLPWSPSAVLLETA